MLLDVAVKCHYASVLAMEVYTNNQRLDGNHLGDEYQGEGFLLPQNSEIWSTFKN